MYGGHLHGTGADGLPPASVSPVRCVPPPPPPHCPFSSPTLLIPACPLPALAPRPPPTPPASAPRPRARGGPGDAVCGTQRRPPGPLAAGPGRAAGTCASRGVGGGGGAGMYSGYKRRSMGTGAGEGGGACVATSTTGLAVDVAKCRPCSPYHRPACGMYACTATETGPPPPAAPPPPCPASAAPLGCSTTPKTPASPEHHQACPGRAPGLHHQQHGRHRAALPVDLAQWPQRHGRVGLHDS